MVIYIIFNCSLLWCLSYKVSISMHSVLSSRKEKRMFNHCIIVTD